MAISPGGHRFTEDSGWIVLTTHRDGLASQVGHDLTIEVTRWSGELVVNDDRAPASLEARMDMRSLVVREGTGGFKPLTDADRRDIAANMTRLLDAGHHPEAEFVATRFERSGETWSADGTFTLRGRSRPLRLRFSPVGPDRYRATGTVLQSAHGIKPYTAFLGALKVRDAVAVEAEVEVPGPAGRPG